MLSLYVAAWIASISSGFEAIVGKIISKHSVSNPWLFNFFWSFFVLIGITISGFWFGLGIPEKWTYIIFGSLMYALVKISFTLALYKIDVSVMGPMFALRTVMAVLIGSIFLGEILTPYQYLLIGIVFLAGIFVSLDERLNLKSFFNKWIGVLLICMLCLVFLAMFIKKSSTVNDFWDTIVWVALLGQIWLLFTVKFFKKDLILTTPQQYGYIGVMALIGTITSIFANFAYSKNISLSAVIISLPISMVLASLLSRFVPELLEKHTLRIYAIRFVAAAVMITVALNL